MFRARQVASSRVSSHAPRFLTAGRENEQEEEESSSDEEENEEESSSDEEENEEESSSDEEENEATLSSDEEEATPFPDEEENEEKSSSDEEEEEEEATPSARLDLSLDAFSGPSKNYMAEVMRRKKLCTASDLFPSAKLVTRVNQNKEFTLEDDCSGLFEKSPNEAGEASQKPGGDYIAVFEQKLSSARGAGSRAGAGAGAARALPSSDSAKDPATRELPSALINYDEASVQDLLYSYFSGEQDKEIDWRAIMHPASASELPGSCDPSGNKNIKIHQMTVYTLCRMWVAKQGSGGGGRESSFRPSSSDMYTSQSRKTFLPPVPLPAFNPLRTPKGIMVFQSTGSGKTCGSLACLQAFWHQRLGNGLPRPLIVMTTVSNRDKLKAVGVGSEKTSDYWKCAQGFFPQTLGMLSSSEFHAGFDVISFNQAGNRLEAADGRGKDYFQDAVIIMDEVQNLFTPKEYVKETEAFLKWLLSPASDRATIIMLTATPGRTPKELIELLDVLRRDEEKLMSDASIVRIKSATEIEVVNLQKFKEAVQGRVAFVDLSNNAADYPTLEVEVSVTEMTPAQLELYKKARLADKGEFKNLQPSERNSFRLQSRKLSNGVPGGTGVHNKYHTDPTTLKSLSSKIYEAVMDLNENATQGKQYLYTAFGNDSLRDLTNALEASGWTDVTYNANLRSAWKQLKILRAKKGTYTPQQVEDAQQKLQRYLDALPGKPAHRFVSTKHWKTESDSHRQRRKEEEGRDASSSNKDAADVLHAASEQAVDVDIYNHDINVWGEYINLILASGTFNEGVDLRAVRRVHILEPLISFASEKQTIGRAQRFCSHIMLPKEKRNVVIKHYFSVPSVDDSSLRDQILRVFQNYQQHEGSIQSLQSQMSLALQQMQVLASRARILNVPRFVRPSGSMKLPLEAGGFWEYMDKEAAHAAKTAAAAAKIPKAPTFDIKLPSAGAAQFESYLKEAHKTHVPSPKPHSVFEGLQLGGEVGAGAGAGAAGVASNGAAANGQHLPQNTDPVNKTLALELLKLQALKMEKKEDPLRDLDAKISMQEAKVQALREQLQQKFIKQVDVVSQQIAAKTAADPSVEMTMVQTSTEEMKRQLERITSDLALETSKRDAVLSTLKNLVKSLNSLQYKYLPSELLKTAGVNVSASAKAGASSAAERFEDLVSVDEEIHVLSRETYKPMADILQALRDAAIDCKVLQDIHTTLGVQVSCKV